MTVRAADRRRARLLAAGVVALLLAACERPAAPPVPSATNAVPTVWPAPLLEGLGSHSYQITTRAPLAQRYFDQGLLLAWAFDFPEAARSFAAAATLDPQCAMCAWGLAYVAGPNINHTERTQLAQAVVQIQRALQLAPLASSKEQALIRALALRYGVDSTTAPAAVAAPVDVKLAPPLALCVARPARPSDAQAAALDRAYAHAMAQAAARFPADLDVALLYAEALLQLAPWDWWDAAGQPRPDTRAAIGVLEGVLAQAPRHPGANHYLIHAYEGSPAPSEALPAALRLGALAPAAAHLVHMPAHVQIRIGRYAEAVHVNQAAIEADAQMAAQIRAQGFEPLSQTAHHHHFLWAVATLDGQATVALDAARALGFEAARAGEPYGAAGDNDYFLALPLLTQVRFARWDEIEAAPVPTGASVYPKAIWHWARGMAQARRANAAAAERELAALRALIADPSLDDRLFKGSDALRAFLEIAAASLQGDVHATRRQWPQAIAALTRAVQLADALESEEPPPWAMSTLVDLAGAQLLAGRAPDAERSARADLARHPANGWALYALAESLKRQGRGAEAARVRAQFAQAWQGADLSRPDIRY